MKLRVERTILKDLSNGLKQGDVVLLDIEIDEVELSNFIAVKAISNSSRKATAMSKSIRCKATKIRSAQ